MASDVFSWLFVCVIQMMCSVVGKLYICCWKVTCVRLEVLMLMASGLVAYALLLKACWRWE